MMATSSNGGGDPFATPGFRFYPTEEELLSFYLRHHLAGTGPHIDRAIPVVDVYSHHPSDLRRMAGEASVRDAEQWFFFCPRAERERHGGRPARSTPSGYWKATGSPSCVFSSSATAATEVIGVKRTMVFYLGRAPSGTKTRWKMNEYKAVDADDAAAAVQPTAPLRLRNEFSVCRVYISTGTLRSFDRRPLDPPGQCRALRQHVPSLATAANTNLADGGVTTSTGQAEDSHDWSSLITAAAAGDFSFDIDFNSTSIGAWPQNIL